MTSYADPSDLVVYSISAAALKSFSTADIQAALDVASSEADNFLGNQFTLPIVKWPVELRMHVCNMATYYLMARRGFDPSGSDETFRLRYDDALKWLANVGRGSITPTGIVDSANVSALNGARAGGPQVITGVTGNTVGSSATPTQQLGKSAPYPWTSTLPGRRGW